MHPNNLSGAVQVNSEAAGVAFSSNPSSVRFKLFDEQFRQADQEVLVEAVIGQGEGLVSGTITPDRYTVHKASRTVIEQSIANKTHKFQLSASGSGTQEVRTSPELSSLPAISSRMLQQIVSLVIDVERHYGTPQDIEWAMQGNHLFLLQVQRPGAQVYKLRMAGPTYHGDCR